MNNEQIKEKLSSLREFSKWLLTAILVTITGTVGVTISASTKADAIVYNYFMVVGLLAVLLEIVVSVKIWKDMNNLIKDIK